MYCDVKRLYEEFRLHQVPSKATGYTIPPLPHDTTMFIYQLPHHCTLNLFDLAMLELVPDYGELTAAIKIGEIAFSCTVLGRILG